MEPTSPSSDPVAHSARRGSRSRCAAAALACIVLTLAACGGSGEDPTAALGAGGPATAPLPTLPPTGRGGGRFDADGCLRTGADTRDCSLPAAARDQLASGAHEHDVRRLAGFVGPRYTTQLTAGAVVVLRDTLSIATTGRWHAFGLVRNETPTSVGQLEVRAELLDGSGGILATASAPVAVAPLRAGEPAPFGLRAEVDAATVASVRWTVVEVAPAVSFGAAAHARAAEVTVHWTRAGNDPRPIENYLRVEGLGDPHPMALFGSVTEVGGEDLAEPRVVAAWLDAEGRVQWLVSSPLASPTASAAPPTAGPWEIVAGVTAEATTPTVSPDAVSPDAVSPAAVSAATASTTTAVPEAGPPATVPTTAPEGADALEVLRAGGLADFLCVLDGAPAGVDGGELMLWVVGR